MHSRKTSPRKPAAIGSGLAASEGEQSEPERGARPEPIAGAAGGPPPDPEVPASPRSSRRRFTAAYKLRILREADACTQPGQLGALLRREGLYSSHLGKWRREAESGALQALANKRRGPKPARRDPLALENDRLRRELQHVQQRLAQAETVIEIQKKLSQILGVTLPENGGKK